MLRYPSSVGSTLYNVDEDEYYRLQFLLGGPGSQPRRQIISTESSLPSLIERTFWSLRESVFAAISAFIERSGISPLNEVRERVFTEHCLGEPLGDRTLDVSLVDHRLLSPALITHLQNEVLAVERLWRLRVVAPFEELSIAIYPRVIRIGRGPCLTTLDDITVELQVWHDCSSRIQNLRFGPEYRQFRDVERRTNPVNLPGADGKPFVFLAAYDNYCGDFDLHTIWLMFRGSESDEIGVLPTGDSDGGVGAIYPLVSPGKLGVKNSTEAAQIWVVQDVRTAAAEHNVPVYGPGEASWSFFVSSNELVRDRELALKPFEA
jgi:hypothetical protein